MVSLSVAPLKYFMQKIRMEMDEQIFRKFSIPDLTPSNSQHLINGFIYGLDHWLHLGSGTYQRRIKSEITGETVDASGRDIMIQPDTGEIKLISGLTQYGRTRR